MACRQPIRVVAAAADHREPFLSRIQKLELDSKAAKDLAPSVVPQLGNILWISVVAEELVEVSASTLMLLFICELCAGPPSICSMLDKGTVP